MSQVATDADAYAASRLNIFFPASSAGGGSSADGDLTGQCVTLVKWFLAEMTAVPNPFIGRGDARYVGQTLVAQGLADEVPYDQRQRGDVICLEYGTYGHIYIQLSDGHVFEENVNWPGVATETVDGATVHASRIGSDSEAWRHDFHAYRIKSYNETGENMQPQIDELNKQLNSTNQYLEKAQADIDELTKQLNSSNGYIDALTKRVAALETGGGALPASGTYKLTKVS